MRYYHTETTEKDVPCGAVYFCNHPLYSRCTLFLIENRGLAIIQQRYDPVTKHTYWTDIDRDLTYPIFSNRKFYNFFDKYADKVQNGVYPTVTVRQIMWALRMKPLEREPWETVFDRKPI